MKILLGIILVFPALVFAADTVVVTVVDQKGNPAADTYVLVGPASTGQNYKKTDQSGRAGFNLIPLKGEPITLSKTGYPKITYLNEVGSKFALKLPPATPAQMAQISGTVTSWSRRDATPEMVKFAFFMPYLSASKLFSFQVSDLIGTRFDPISIYGNTYYVPSNLMAPQQTIHYGFIPITFEKPGFEFDVAVPDTYNFLAIAGQFPFQLNKEGLPPKPGLEMINKMELLSYGSLRNQTITQTTSNILIDAHQGKIAPCLDIASSNAPAGYDTLGVALVRADDIEGRPFQPTDVKKTGATPLQVRCVANDQRPIDIFNVAIKHKTVNNVIVIDKGITSILARDIPRQNTLQQISASNYFAIPQVTVSNNGQSVQASRPEAGRSPKAEALYAVLSDVSQQTMGNFVVENVTPKWIVWGSGSQNSFELPQLPAEMEDAPLASTRRWELTWLGMDHRKIFNGELLRSVDLGYDLFETMTHASRNAQDF